jgi:hypothetical protein
MNPDLIWMVAIFRIAGNPDSGAVDGTRIAVAAEYQRAPTVDARYCIAANIASGHRTDVARAEECLF